MEFKAEDITQSLSNLKESNGQKDRILVKYTKRRSRQLNMPRAIADTVNDMGGTLGAILGILLRAFNNALKRQLTSQEAVTAAIFSNALGTAVESFEVYTTAREGDRTVMDVLIPFTDEFVQTRSFEAAM
ncbi:DAK2 domain-containing protein [Fusarium solani]|uniref:DAK2 domain-containing protein n=2 Tax=Fusarium solani TaxID=169388 RepID=A0A9P9HDL4_FUSSL|nr:DAK2 domain-containing protein [Fusarium solani]KAH7254544.1 DAK2 domain-containing protein [Fusarium solani]